MLFVVLGAFKEYCLVFSHSEIFGEGGMAESPNLVFQFHTLLFVIQIINGFKREVAHLSMNKNFEYNHLSHSFSISNHD